MNLSVFKQPTSVSAHHISTSRSLLKIYSPKDRVLFAFGQHFFSELGQNSVSKIRASDRLNTFRSKEKNFRLSEIAKSDVTFSAGCFPVAAFNKVRNTLQWWLVVPTIFLAAVLGFVCGKRKTTGKTVSSPDNRQNINIESADFNSTVVTEKYENAVEDEKPFFRKYDLVTVLFADIEGFSRITDSMDPESLLEELNKFFFYFDTVVERYRIEKIKTMGDAYMCAGGIPQINNTNPVEVVLAALDVRDYLNRWRKQNRNAWPVRIGIHTGPVMAGMLGRKKMSYDIWGHTVNVAARMESSCTPGEINISEATYHEVNRFFECEYRGKISDKADEESYFVKGLNPDFSETKPNGETTPNRDFFIQLQLVRLKDLEEHLKNDIIVGADLPFHNFEHAHDVCEQAELLGQAEHIAADDMLLVKTAALLHDAGYAVSYATAAEESEQIARKTLPLFQYDRQQTDTICRLMKDAHYESSPTDILGQIMHDANLMYYGRAGFAASVLNLYNERSGRGLAGTKTEWLQSRIECLSGHRFYTQAAKDFVQVSAEKQIADINRLLATEQTA